jgi:hypothetical protein
VAANGGSDAVFDSFSFETSAQEILLNLIRTYLPVGVLTRGAGDGGGAEPAVRRRNQCGKHAGT